ncbi:MAG: hypothetical protein UY40_C0002G0022 [candidate division CPR1 bacterium GW2011_GWC1_49_13]|uniref:Uncharacterized protein n=1 Tax=candidate division CPR1 bacterium GW2011_GWC1_49_13 TaxID=1618342 RepID=A0A0G1XUC1_9BACT|nr:MAG: hypothetical protein UY40_C0002G0022 [candidate division CPR1 bacterium GW2011_GWC1_49_13]
MQYRVKRQLSSIFTTLLLAFGQLFPFLTIFSTPAYAVQPPNANLDQCRNGAVGSPQDCVDVLGPLGWENGNAGSSNSHFVEGESIPYRAILENLPTGVPITLTLGYDIKNSGKFAIDYLTTYDRTDVNVDPTDGTTASGTADDTSSIPAPSSSGSPVSGEPATSFNSLPSDERVMSIWNGSISAIAYASEGNLGASGNAETTISVTFTADDPTVILSWGGHIASRLDWGFDGSIPRSAGGISGSSYHMRLTGWSGHSSLGTLGNTDKSLSTDAVVPPGNVIIEKQTSPDGSQQTFDFTGAISGSISDGQQLIASIAPGQHAVTESLTSQWNLTNLVCDDGNSTGDINTRTATINVESFETVTCTFTNTIEDAHLIVIKHVVNDNGGTASAGDFTMTINGVTADGGNSFAGSESPGTNKVVSLGSYSVSESGPSGYSASYSADCTGTSVAGQTKTCTVTNDDQPGTLIVNKIVIKDDGGLLNAEDFSFQVNGGSQVDFEGDGQNYITVNAGTYSVTEVGVVGWTTTYDNCGGLVISNGGFATCTITNDDQPGTLIVIKNLIQDNGGDEVYTDFSFSINNDSIVDDFEGDGENQYTVSQGYYSIVEDAAPGYVTSYENCDNVFVPNGGSATCTITNDDIAPTVTLRKVVQNDHGGTADADDFGLTVGINPVSSGQTIEVLANTPVALGEAGLPGYSFVSLTGDNGCPAELGGTVTLNEDEDITCTITNTDIDPQITVNKVVINDNGGQLGIGNFPLFVGDTSVVSGETNEFIVGTYIVSETNQPGYTQSFSGDCDENGSITVGLGESKTCTITNDDNAPSLTLVKELINDNGGTATEASWVLAATGPNGFSDVGPVVYNGASFDAGTYDLLESGPAGYTPSDWVCEGGTQVDGDTVVVGLGESVTCTITNDDNVPSLTLVKHVIKDNGGTASETDWTLTATGPTSISGPGGAISDATFDAGTYVLSESVGPSGYTASGWTCSNQDNDGTISIGLGDSVTCEITNDDISPELTVIKHVINDDGGLYDASAFFILILGTNVSQPFFAGDELGTTLTLDEGSYFVIEIPYLEYSVSYSLDCDGFLGVGESATCTITNDDIAPTLKLVKEVEKDNGGNDFPSDWTLTATGVVESDRDFSDSGDSDTFHTVFANETYILSESGPSGYSEGSWSCDGGIQEGNYLALGLGENVTCTITNDDIAPTITLYKEVNNNNGGTARENDFGLTIGETTVLSGQTLEVDANTPYELNETGLFGYQFVSLTNGEGSETCPEILGGTVTLSEGEDLTCVITNEDIAPNLTVIKRVINNSEGTAVASDFTISVSGLNVSSPLFAGNEAGTTVSLDAGQYLVTELLAQGYTVSYSSDCEGTIGVGESKICTVTNNDQDILGADTELPETGADPLNVAVALSALQVGLFLRRKVKKS